MGHSRLTAADVGDSATSPCSGAVRSAFRGRSELLSILSHALMGHSDEQGGAGDEFEGDEGPDLADDDCPQGFVAAASFSGLSIPRCPAPYVESNLGIQPSIGHPRGDDEPPRV